MEINPTYGIVAVELGDKIYKAYIWNGSYIQKKIGKIFHIKFGNWDDHTNSYDYKICSEDITDDDDYKPKYSNKYENNNDDDLYDTTPESDD